MIMHLAMHTLVLFDSLRQILCNHLLCYEEQIEIVTKLNKKLWEIKCFTLLK